MGKLKVNIRAKQVVYYDQFVEMDEETYEELSSIHDEDELAKALDNYIDKSDVMDAEDLERGEIYLEEN